MANRPLSVFLQQSAERPETPPHLRKYRKSNYANPGQRVVHYGIFDDMEKKDPNGVFGTVGTPSDHVEHIWYTPGIGSEYEEAKYAQKEATYRSSKREPLGKSFLRGQTMPDRMKTDSFRFGRPSDETASAKPLLYPQVTENHEEFLESYIKSHGSYPPGMQTRRNYSWGFDVKSHAFGVGVGSQSALNGNSKGVAEAMTSADVPRITTKKTEDMKALNDQLGRVRNLGHGNKASHPKVYGKTSLTAALGAWDARACIEGDYSWQDQEPDLDLGKSQTPGFRNVTSETRAFGTPTVRSDIPKLENRSIADNQNYGDDVSAQFLLYPQQFASMGVDDSEFSNPRQKDELIDIFRTSGVLDQLSEAQIEVVWKTAVADAGGFPSVVQFQVAVNDMVEAQR